MTAAALPERAAGAERASLRRADWRFLLPAPPAGGFAHMALLGGPSGLAERLIEIGLARHVSRALPGDRSADAVVALHDARVPLAAAAASLAPGGSLYYEIDRRRPAHLTDTPARARVSLLAAGLRPTGCYWAAPAFEGCKRYLPLDEPGALRWYLGTLYAAGTPLHQLVGLAMRALASAGSGRFAALAPCYAITAVNGADTGTPSVLGRPELRGLLPPGPLRPAVLTSGQDEGSRAVLLPFAAGAERPSAVVKLATVSGFNANTEREQAALASIRARLDDRLRPSIPQPLGQLRYGDLAVGVESCAAGPTLVASSGSWGAPAAHKIADLRAVASWLAEFHRQTVVARPSWGAEQAAHWVEQPLDDYARRFGLAGAEPRLFAAARARAGQLAGAVLPIALLHNDLGPWNIYRSGERLTVIDWEMGAEADPGRYGPGLCDLVYFVTHWSYVARHRYGEAAELAGFAELFAGAAPDTLLRDARQTLAEYLAALAIDARFLPLLLAYTWVRRALDRADRQSALGGAAARAGNRYVQYVGILAAHTDRLFAASLPLTSSPRLGRGN